MEDIHGRWIWSRSCYGTEVAFKRIDEPIGNSGDPHKHYPRNCVTFGDEFGENGSAYSARNYGDSKPVPGLMDADLESGLNGNDLLFAS